MLRLWILVFAFSVVLVKGNPAIPNLDKSVNDIEGTSKNVIDTDSFGKCSFEGGITGLINCAATRALKIIQHAAKTESFELLPGVALTDENSSSQRKSKAIKDDELPTDPKQKSEKLLSLILDAASQFFSGRTLRIKIPEISAVGVSRAIEEGRRKMKKGMSPLLLGLGAKLLLFKGLLILGLGLMAVKALLLSKIAFVLAVILGAQSLFGGSFNLKNIGGSPYLGGHGWISGWSSSNNGHGPSYGTPNYPGWTTNSIGGWGNSQYPYARSIDNVSEELDESRINPQDLAYSKQKP